MERAPGQGEPETAAKNADESAFEEEVARDAAAAGAERGADGEFLMTAFGANEHQVGNVGACDEEHNADAAHQDPEELAHVADDIAHEGAHSGTEARLLKQLDAEAGRGGEAGPNDGDHARDVGVCGFEGLPGAEARDAVIAELAQ